MKIRNKNRSKQIKIILDLVCNIQRKGFKKVWGSIMIEVLVPQIQQV